MGKLHSQMRTLDLSIHLSVFLTVLVSLAVFSSYYSNFFFIFLGPAQYFVPNGAAAGTQPPAAKLSKEQRKQAARLNLNAQALQADTEITVLEKQIAAFREQLQRNPDKNLQAQVNIKIGLAEAEVRILFVLLFAGCIVSTMFVFVYVFWFVSVGVGVGVGMNIFGGKCLTVSWI